MEGKPCAAVQYCHHKPGSSELREEISTCIHLEHLDRLQKYINFNLLKALDTELAEPRPQFGSSFLIFSNCSYQILSL